MTGRLSQDNEARVEAAIAARLRWFARCAITPATAIVAEPAPRLADERLPVALVALQAGVRLVEKGA